MQTFPTPADFYIIFTVIVTFTSEFGGDYSHADQFSPAINSSKAEV